jgi:hypothetical protein
VEERIHKTGWSGAPLAGVWSLNHCSSNGYENAFGASEQFYYGLLILLGSRSGADCTLHMHAGKAKNVNMKSEEGGTLERVEWN